MASTGLKYYLDENDVLSEEVELQLINEKDLKDLRTKYNRAAFIVNLVALEKLKSFSGAIIDRLKKDPRKSLAVLLLGHDKIPLIEGNYSGPRQVNRSIKAFLKNAKKQSEQNIFFIGVKPEIYVQLRNNLLTKEVSESYTTADQKDSSKNSQMDNLSYTYNALPNITIPEKFSEKYQGKSIRTKLVLKLTTLAARTHLPVLIMGETGTGKEIIAKLIHENSVNHGGHFVPVNCGAISPELFESELFGHEKGAFTGALFKKTGLWALADGGTLFLDEIGELLPSHQVKILRALQEREILPVGAIKTVKTNPRIIAATNRDLYSMVQNNEFREDLYYRIRSLFIHTPALRQNMEDISIIAQKIWQQISSNSSAQISAEAMKKIVRLNWNGNVRELKSVLVNIKSIFQKDILSTKHLDIYFQVHEIGSFRDKNIKSKKVKMDDGIAFHLIECIKHLKRTSASLQNLWIRLKYLDEDKRVSIYSSSDHLALLKSHHAELEALIQNPQLFSNNIMFRSILKIYEGFHLFFCSYEDKKILNKHSIEQLEKNIKNVQAQIFKLIDTLIKRI